MKKLGIECYFRVECMYNTIYRNYTNHSIKCKVQEIRMKNNVKEPLEKEKEKEKGKENENHILSSLQ